MANPAPTINQINAFNATQGTTIDFNIIGGTELVRSNRIYIYDLSDNSLICTHLYVSTESIHELPPNTDGSIVYESGKSSADFVNGAQYYAQIQTFTDIAGTEGGSGLSVAKLFWCLVDPTLTITTIPSTISTTSYNVSATYNANTSVVSNIIQQYQFSLYSATGSLLQSSGVVVGSGTQQGTSDVYDISYNFTGLNVGSSYYVTVGVTTTQGMSVTTQSNTFTVSIDTPTLGEATVVNNACDGYISVTSNLSSEYGGSGSGEIVSFETDSENVFTKLQVDLEPVQDLHGYDKPWSAGTGANKWDEVWENGWISSSGDNRDSADIIRSKNYIPVTPNTTYCIVVPSSTDIVYFDENKVAIGNTDKNGLGDTDRTVNTRTTHDNCHYIRFWTRNQTTYNHDIAINYPSTVTTYSPYSNICPISGHDEVDVEHTGKNFAKASESTEYNGQRASAQYTSNTTTVTANGQYARLGWLFKVVPNEEYTLSFKGHGSGANRNVYISYKEDAGKLSNPNDQWATGNYSTNFQIGSTETEYIRRFVALGEYVFFGCYVTANTTDGDMVISDLQLERGLEATAYEPYSAESFHQDIEATYTPTVQENTPYLFKQTGDVRGDRESIELVGGSVAWNQLAPILNSTNWTSESGVTATYSDGVATISSTVARNGIYFRRNIIANHKYLLTCELKSESEVVVLCGSSSGIYAEIHLSGGEGWKRASAIQYKSADQTSFRLYVYGTIENYNIQAKNFMLIDLTQMFGTTIADYIYSLEQANAGAGVAWFKKLFPKPYYEYNAGELMSVNTSAHNTVGFNQWDEEWELGSYSSSTGNKTSSSDSIRSKNKIKVLPSTAYYFQFGSGAMNGIYFYDADENYLGLDDAQGASIPKTLTTPANAHYMTFQMNATYGTTYNNNICINLSWDGERNGEYEPYVEHSYPLDDSLTLRGIPKIANGKLYYDGDTYESDGTVTRKYGIVDLGTLDWVYNSTTLLFRTGLTDGIKAENAEIHCVCQKYRAVVGYNPTGGINDTTQDKVISVGSSYDSINNNLLIRDTSYTDATTFKTAMSGVYLVYELATPTTETADPFESIQKVTPNYGTEEFVTTTNVPVGNNTQYYTREIYGGTVDLVSGVLVDDLYYVADIADFTWTTRATGSVNKTLSVSMGTGYYPVSSVQVFAEKFGYNGGVAGAFALSNPDSKEVGLYTYNSGKYDDSLYCVLPIGDTPSGAMCYTKFTPQTYQLTPQQIQTLVGQNNVWSEQGDVELSYHIPITNLLVKRQDVADVSGNWLTLYSQPVEQASDMDFTFIDFLNQYGKTYKYALVPLLNQTQSGVEVEVEGGYTVSDEVQSVFDGVFIVDSTGSQKCKANVGYGNVDMNQTVGTITPIGAKYPVVITNSQNQYHNGSISGTIVPDDYYFNGNLSRIDMVNKRDELEQFLTNKRAKIIKDWNGKIWLVMIMDNVSCTFNNNYGMGIVNFSTNWVEVGDPTNQQDLQATGLINIGGA